MYYFLLFISIIILTACGGGGGSTNESGVLLSTFPTKITVNLPLKLEPNRNMLTLYSDKSYIYETMQSNIIKYRDSSNEIKDDLNILEKLLDPIINACVGTSVDETCSLEANQFSFNLSKKELRIIKKNYAELSIDFNINKTLYLGKITFIEHNRSNPYHYSLTIDMTNAYVEILGDSYKKFYEKSLEKRLLNISWSTDNKTVYTALSVETNSSKETTEFEYFLEENSSETIYVYEDGLSTTLDWDGEPYETRTQDTMLFRKNFDENNSYDYRMQNDNKFEIGHISDHTGSHISSALDDNSQIIVFFDEKGVELGQYGCLGLDGCSIEDKSTWSIEYEEELTASNLDKKTQLYLRNFKASDISLDEGKYFLLAPSVKIEELSKEEILKQSIGEFIVTKTELIGVLSDAQYENKLSELKITQDLSSKLIPVENYPLFILQKEVVDAY